MYSDVTTNERETQKTKQCSFIYTLHFRFKSLCNGNVFRNQTVIAISLFKKILFFTCISNVKPQNHLNFFLFNEYKYHLI